MKITLYLFFLSFGIWFALLLFVPYRLAKTAIQFLKIKRVQFRSSIYSSL